MTREEIAARAMALPIPAVMLVPAKTIVICRELGMATEQIRALVLKLDVFEIVRAAFVNSSIQAHRQHERWRSVWTDESLLRNPPMRVEFPYATVFASVPEARQISHSKTWGPQGVGKAPIVGLLPLRKDDVIDPCQITYTLKACAPQRQRWEWRDTLKALLGRDRGLVVKAMGHSRYRSQAEFLKTVTAGEAKTLARKLEMTPEEFWVACRHGDRFGRDSIHRYVARLREKTEGFSFDFGE